VPKNKGVRRMAIECKLSVLMGECRYNMQSVIDKTGLERNTISRLYHDKVKRIDYKTLDKLCELFDCEPSDILKYSKNKAE
jgi:putative transcriptional regulator